LFNFILNDLKKVKRVKKLLSIDSKLIKELPELKLIDILSGKELYKLFNENIKALDGAKNSQVENLLDFNKNKEKIEDILKETGGKCPVCHQPASVIHILEK